MKNVFLIFAFLLIGFNNIIKAQYIEPIEYLRFDSVSTMGDVKGIIEDSSFYYLYNASNVVSINKLTSQTDTILNSVDPIKSSFLDSSGTLGILLSNKIMYWQNNTWQVINIGNLHAAKYCMVDGAGALWIAVGNDSLYSYTNGNWNKYKFTFIGSNEFYGGLVAGIQNECLVYTYFNDSIKIYQPLGLNPILLYEIPSCGYFNCYIDIDELGRVWYLDDNKIKYKNSSGVESQLLAPSALVNSFRLSDNLNKLWAIIRTNNVDTLYFFDGNNWQLSYTKLEYNIPYQAKSDKLLLKNYSFSANGQNLLSSLRVFESNVQTQIYTFGQAMITSKVTSIHIDDSYNNSGLGEFLVGTHDGLVRKKYNFGMQSSYQIWDSTNSSLPSNYIYNIDSKSDYNWWGASDTIYLATNSGLVKALLNEDSLIVVQVINSQNSVLPFDTVSDLFIEETNGPNANVWLGSPNSGAAMINENGVITVYDTANSLLPSNHIKDITSNANIVCIVTDHGFMTIKDSVQQVYTMSNSGLLTNDINFVAIYQGYGSGNYDLLIGTNGFGFATLDVNNQWHYYNTANQNFDSDSVYYLRINVPWLVDKLLGTNHGIKALDGSAANVTFSNIMIQNDDNNKRNIDGDNKEVPCASFGYRFGSLCDQGIVRYQVCFGSIAEKETSLPKFKSWLNRDALYIQSDLIGNFNLDIFDLTGRSIHSCKIALSNQTVIALPALSESIYFVRLTDGKNAYSNKLIYTK
jgi:hypothetical protein